MSPARPGPIEAHSGAGPRGQVWAWAVLPVTVLVLALSLFIHAAEREALGRAGTYLDTLRGARLNLVQGFLQVSLGGSPDSPYDREAGLALLAQALGIFERAVSSSSFLRGEESRAEVAAFTLELARLEEELAQHRGPARGPAEETALRLGLFELERRADRLDSLGRAELAALSSRLERLFLLMVLGSACLFGLVGLFVLRSLREAERARGVLEAALGRSEVLARSLSERDELIRRELAEKVVLLQEIHHRVKNNLQVVSSLFALDARAMRDPEDAAVLSRSQDRVHAMALVHELLHESESLSAIDAAEYVRRLALRLGESYGSEGGLGIGGLASLSLPIDRATSFGLLLHEAISNAYKHGRREGEEPRIEIGLRLEGGSALLEVADEGPGLRRGLDPASSESLGLSLLRNLALQLGGEAAWLAREGGRGLLFRLRFPAPAPCGGPA